MALRHYGRDPSGEVRQPPEPITEWVCPTCHTKQTGQVSKGCQTCGAGHDAVKGAPPLVPADQPGVVHPPARRGTDPPVSPGGSDPWSFEEWFRTEKERLQDMSQKQALEEAYAAGRMYESIHPVGQSSEAWQATFDGTPPRPEPRPEPAAAIDPATVEAAGPTHTLVLFPVNISSAVLDRPVEPLDDQTLDTIVAALDFYLTNQLAYGTMPNQLSADQVHDFLNKIAPKATEAP